MVLRDEITFSFCHAFKARQASLVKVKSVCDTLLSRVTFRTSRNAALKARLPSIAFEPSKSDYDAVVWEHARFVFIIRSLADHTSHRKDTFAYLVQQTRATRLVMQHQI